MWLHVYGLGFLVCFTCLSVILTLLGYPELQAVLTMKSLLANPSLWKSEIPDTIVAGNRKRKKATHSREFLPKTKPIKITFFVFKCHHQKATIQSHLMPLPMLSLSSVTSWAISFHLEDVMAPSRHCPVIKTNTSDEKTLTAVPLGNLSMVTEIHYKKHQQQLVKVQENQTTPPQYLQTA